MSRSKLLLIELDEGTLLKVLLIQIISASKNNNKWLIVYQKNFISQRK